MVPESGLVVSVHKESCRATHVPRVLNRIIPFPYTCLHLLAVGSCWNLDIIPNSQIPSSSLPSSNQHQTPQKTKERPLLHLLSNHRLRFRPLLPLPLCCRNRLNSKRSARFFTRLNHSFIHTTFSYSCPRVSFFLIRIVTASFFTILFLVAHHISPSTRRCTASFTAH